ncbi:GUN4 N-terminal ARM-like repeat domain-containing protein [Desertifilum sp. FACHB-1129]|uniref:GUN4-like domain-containing protein n=1 Tax=Desertifilum tharense IPPAS B-1220 TaxID=1781255 RepID=A0A1E5QHC8_9CYAN|nr:MULTISPECIES: GUN4 domain-containing protein [Desertifilum]MCD8485656.1 GUN4 domain-containing protein [Desertifilum sp.]MDA0213456.1 GUN4 N-terminal ARM-like repeat domain-containing protein [Cyanobacteria bacterium FC1]MBD2314581.1 GUN4 N-terminal ARM-like repeat domain-containing protein [Desertifilum sp. FACHB-1129]MBD2322939.1 GUN4 N-terminal ARM-like repeat domain-containing protein [Desertifilum sp. FACHB-866]MBD2335188.1 GUN4 N-terminal ARM-like repeat domain-containing protein [Des
MSDPTTDNRSDLDTNLSQLAAQLRSGTTKNQLASVHELASAGAAGEQILMEILKERHSNSSPTPVEGKIYQALFASPSTEVQDFLQTHFPTGLVPLTSERNIDYLPLQRLLAKQDFLESDRLTITLMCELAGRDAQERKWLYFTEVDRFPNSDLKTLDTLWFIHSEGKFGFSVQRELWLSLGRNWEKLWPKIGWKLDNQWTRYPNAFTWDLSAPRGHLPLSNQLRGVRVFSSLLNHPAWQS